MYMCVEASVDMCVVCVSPKRVCTSVKACVYVCMCVHTLVWWASNKLGLVPALALVLVMGVRGERGPKVGVASTGTATSLLKLFFVFFFLFFLCCVFACVLVGAFHVLLNQESQ